MNVKLISGYLKLLRKKHSYTQTRLAEELHISRQAVSRWENGNALPDLELLLKLSELYHVTINDIINPKIEPNLILDFEQLPEIDETDLKDILADFTSEDIIKASMGASPQMNNFLKTLLPEIDFKAGQESIGAIRVEEVESAQNQIVGFINLRDYIN